MTDTNTIDWQGRSGRTYRYWVHQLPPNFKPESGNYIFAKRDTYGRWVPVYIGQTEDLSDRFADHHASACIDRNGATHIHAHTNGDKNARVYEERDLIENYNPVCNLVHVR